MIIVARAPPGAEFAHRGVTAAVFCLATEAAPDRANEDFALASTDLAVVVDGDGPPGADADCSHGAAWFARQLGTHVVAALADEPGLPLVEALGRAVRTVARLHVYTCDLGSAQAPSAAVGILRLGEDRVDTLAVGGCAVVVDTDAGPQVTLDGGDTPAVVGSDPQVAQRAVTNSYPRDWVRRAALFSDGAAWAVDGRPGTYGWPEYLDLLDKLGPAALLATTRAWWASARRADAGPPDDATVVHVPDVHAGRPAR